MLNPSDFPHLRFAVIPEAVMSALIPLLSAFASGRLSVFDVCDSPEDAVSLQVGLYQMVVHGDACFSGTPESVEEEYLFAVALNDKAREKANAVAKVVEDFANSIPNDLSDLA